MQPEKSKDEIRSKYIILRNKLPLYKKKKLDREIEKCVLNSSVYKNSNTIMIYSSFGSEVNTLTLIKKMLKDGKNVVLPKTKKPNKIIPIKINSLNELKKGNFSILEPTDISKKVKKSTIDVVFVPGIVFDKHGNRIGFGKGYYDHFLKYIPYKKRIGVCYEFQIVENIPINKTDIPVSKIITEKGILNCNRGGEKK